MKHAIVANAEPKHSAHRTKTRVKPPHNCQKNTTFQKKTKSSIPHLNGHNAQSHVRGTTPSRTEEKSFPAPSRKNILPHPIRNKSVAGIKSKETQQKGYIRPSKSPYAALLSSSKKKTGNSALSQDYRQISKWTIKNRCTHTSPHPRTH